MKKNKTGKNPPPKLQRKRLQKPARNPMFWGKQMTVRQARRYAREHGVPFAPWMATPAETRRERAAWKKRQVELRKGKTRRRKEEAARRKGKVVEMPKRNPLFTRSEKRRMKKRVKHAVKGATRRGILGLFGLGKKKTQERSASSARGHRSSSPAASGVRADVVSAVVNQGYSRAAAAAMVPQPSAGESFDSLFRRAMKRNPRKKRKRNPDQSAEDLQAAKAFRGFHGADVDQVLNVTKKMVEQGKYWLVGRLAGYDLHELPKPPAESKGNRRPNVDTWNANIMLCADPPRGPQDKLGRQLFLWGGDQDLEWALKQHFGVKSNVQLVVLGQIDRIYYVTRKSMHNFELETYVHKFGEEGGERPLLMYDRLNKKQWIVGGDYTITERGIEN